MNLALLRRHIVSQKALVYDAITGNRIGRMFSRMVVGDLMGPSTDRKKLANLNLIDLHQICLSTIPNPPET